MELLGQGHPESCGKARSHQGLSDSKAGSLRDSRVGSLTAATGASGEPGT